MIQGLALVVLGFALGVAWFLWAIEPHRGRVRPCVAFHADLDCEQAPLPCPTLQLLAMPYADHPDYDPSWQR